MLCNQNQNRNRNRNFLTSGTGTETVTRYHLGNLPTLQGNRVHYITENSTVPVRVSIDRNYKLQTTVNTEYRSLLYINTLNNHPYIKIHNDDLCR